MNIAFFFLLLSIAHSALIYCKIDDELDPHEASNYCSSRYIKNDLKPGDYCLLRPERVRPTQVFVGKVEMECTKSEIESLNSSSLHSFIIENQVPTIIGPGPDFFITDHHHFAVAMFQAFLDFKRPTIHRVMYACIQADYSTMSMTNFWSTMKSQKFVFLEDERGNNITVDTIPDTLKLMADNPYRTFASWLRNSNAYVKCGTKQTRKLPQCKHQSAPFFLECYWADFMREKFPINDYPTQPDVYPRLKDFIYRASLQLQTEALMSVLDEALQYAVARESEGMPGFNSVQDLLPLQPVELNASGCPK